MKFKDYGNDKRLIVTDKDGDELELRHYANDKGLVAFIESFGVTSHGVSLTRKKAIKLAWAIINEMAPIA